MKAIYAFGLLVVIAFLGSRFLFKRKDFFSPLNYFFLSGLIYIFLGLLLGQKVLNVLSPDILKDFTPLVNLGLGWVGFLFGFQFEYRYLRKFPQKYIGLSFLQFLLVVCLGVAVLFFSLRYFFPSQPPYLLYIMAVSLSLLLSINSPSLLNFASSMIPVKGNYYYLARFLVSVSGFWGIAGLIIISSFWHYPFDERGVFIKGLILLLSSTFFAVLIGLLFHYLIARRASEHDLLVCLLGLVFFVSGAASYFNLPSLYICMIMGITFSNLTKIQEKFYPLLLSTEKPFYIIFLVLIGALWEISFNYKIALLIIFLLFLRVLGHSLPLKPLGRVLQFSFPLPAIFGLFFLSSGGIAVAFVVSLKMIYPLLLTDIFISVALLVTVVSEILGAWILKNSLIRIDSEE